MLMVIVCAQANADDTGRSTDHHVANVLYDEGGASSGADQMQSGHGYADWHHPSEDEGHAQGEHDIQVIFSLFFSIELFF